MPDAPALKRWAKFLRPSGARVEASRAVESSVEASRAAERSGESELKLAYRRAWEETAPPAGTFTVRIQVST